MIYTVASVIMIVLGCHIQDIQNSRIQTALEFSKQFDSQYQTWFLTGGVKHAIASTLTEAENMKSNINFDANIILDTSATNTAENFLNFKKWYQHAEFAEKPQIVITTSSFHKDRAEQILKGIFNDVEIVPVWNLSDLACPTCWSDELIHVKNVKNDVEKALRKFNL